MAALESMKEIEKKKCQDLGWKRWGVQLPERGNAQWPVMSGEALDQATEHGRAHRAQASTCARDGDHPRLTILAAVFRVVQGLEIFHGDRLRLREIFFGWADYFKVRSQLSFQG
jgi:hypothetical protein